MRIRLEKTKVIHVEVELPAYFKFGATYFKIISDTTAITVTEDEYEIRIEKSSWQKGNTASAATQGTRITEQEFIEAFERVTEKVKRELSKSLETDRRKAQEQRMLIDNALAIVEDNSVVDMGREYKGEGY